MVSIGRITDEGVENLGARLGSYYKGGPTLVEITEDAIYNYAVDNGDENPLYIDPDYAARSRFGGIIAPPAIVDVHQALHRRHGWRAGRRPSIPTRETTSPSTGRYGLGTGSGPSIAPTR